MIYLNSFLFFQHFVHQSSFIIHGHTYFDFILLGLTRNVGMLMNDVHKIIIIYLVFRILNYYYIDYL